MPCFEMMVPAAHFFFNAAQSAGPVEYIDCVYAER